jgi:urease accessory protein
VTIAIRHVPLAQTEGQAVLARLLPQIHALADRATRATLDEIGTCALAGDLAALQHEVMDVRIFRT